MSRIKKFGIGLGVVTILFIALGAIVGNPPASHNAQATAAAHTTATPVASTPTPAPAAAKSTPTPDDAAPAPAPKPEPKPQMTAGQKQAIESAQSYLSMGGFSKRGLINQLSSSAGEGFSTADATYAVNHVDVDWNQQAVDSAQSYLKMGGFSRQGLIDQLTSSAGESFTPAQADYAVSKVYR